MNLNHVSSYFPVCFAWLLGACATGPADESALSAPHDARSDEAAEAPGSDEAAEIADRAIVVRLAPGPGTDDQTICRTETVTGTHRERTVCQTRAERRATRSAAQEWYRSGGRAGGISRVPTVH